MGLPHTEALVIVDVWLSLWVPLGGGLVPIRWLLRLDSGFELGFAPQLSATLIPRSPRRFSDIGTPVNLKIHSGDSPGLVTDRGGDRQDSSDKKKGGLRVRAGSFAGPQLCVELWEVDRRNK